MKVEIQTKTDGSGLWSNRATSIRIVELRVNYYDKDDPADMYGNMSAVFHKDDWNVDKDGLIYTDDQWEKDLHKGLVALGVPESAMGGVGYSECGMQENDAVNLDVGHEFLTSELGKKLIAECDAPKKDPSLDHLIYDGMGQQKEDGTSTGSVRP